MTNPSTFQQKFAINLSRGAYMLVLFFMVLMIGFVTFFIISYTSLKRFIPGYPDIENADKIYEADQQNMELLRVYEDEANKRSLWIKNLQAILSNNDSLLLSDVTDSITIDSNYKNIVFERPIEDSILRAQVERENELIKVNEMKGLLNKLNYIMPVDYLSYQSSARTTTFKTNPNIDVIACMKGIVVSITNTSAIIQHSDDLLSIYQNCADLNVLPGDQVTRGKEIGVVSDSVFNFELWHRGKSVNVKKILNQ